MHYYSDRVSGPFVAVNCKSFAEGVLESELFSHEKGAFTGAERTKPGLFERADGGTLFLDEIAEVGGDFQGKLLRVLQERTLYRVGGTVERAIDVRLVAATNRDLPGEVAAGRFREDLYFRLAVIPIHLPPLRERREDILPLARHFLAKWNADMSRHVAGWTAAVETYLQSYSWPGNVRELENTIERGVVLAQHEAIELEDLLIDASADAVVPEGCSRPENLQTFLNRAAADHIRTVLKEVGGVRREAAKRLGIERTTLYRLMRKYGGITGEG